MKDIYKITHECRNHDSTRFWQMFQVMTALNGALLAFIGTQVSDITFVRVASGFGASISFLWLMMQIRYAFWCKHWERKLKEFEPTVIEKINAERASMKPPLAPVRLFTEEVRTPMFSVSTKHTPLFIAALFVVAWITLAFSGGWSKGPNKAPEPTPTAVTPRAMDLKPERKKSNLGSPEARVAPAVGVAHL